MVHSFRPAWLVRQNDALAVPKQPAVAFRVLPPLFIPIRQYTKSAYRLQIMPELLRRLCLLAKTTDLSSRRQVLIEKAKHRPGRC